MFKSQLLPGIYHIRNVHYDNHAVLHNDNEPNDLYSDVLDGKDAGPRVSLSNFAIVFFFGFLVLRPRGRGPMVDDLL